MEALRTTDETRAGSLVSQDAESFTVRTTLIRTLTYKRGYGVHVDLVYRGEDEDSDEDPDEPVAFDAYVVEIRPEDVIVIRNVPCLKLGHNAGVPLENFGDDESDLAAARFFETEREAIEHCNYISQRLSQNGLVAA